MKSYILICFVLFFAYIQGQSAVIIVHGTWASNEAWYQPCGDFFKSINLCCQQLQMADVVIPFAWSGGLGLASQQAAAEQLVALIVQYDFVIIIGHSHGGTVATLASNILGKHAKKERKIAKMYILGMPIPYDMSIYPDMNVIEYCYNLFSFGDYIQRIGGVYTRVFVPHERLANLAVKIHDWYPTHSGLHSRIIGSELLKIHSFLAEKQWHNFEQFDFLKPGQITFFEKNLPHYFVQQNQRELLDIDLKYQWKMMHHDSYRNYTGMTHQTAFAFLIATYQYKNF